PPKLIVTPTKLTLMDPFHRSMTQNNSDGGRPPHYTKTRAPAISSQSRPRNGHLSVSTAPTWTEASALPVRKMGVASLLFHRTLSPKDTLQVQSYTLEKQQDRHTQLQVHSYAREHQPRHLQNKTGTVPQAQALSLAPICDKTEPEPEAPVLQIEEELNESEAQSPVVEKQNDNKPEKFELVQDPIKMKASEVQVMSKSTLPQTQTQLHELCKVKMEASKVNKRKVCVP
ncbi:hypothetical protein XENOCAPTIV_018038, partial [Xenoophorus captivus]